MSKLTRLVLGRSELSGEHVANVLKANSQLLELATFQEQLQLGVPDQLPPTELPPLRSIRSPSRFMSLFALEDLTKRERNHYASPSLQATVRALPVLSHSATPITDLNLFVLPTQRTAYRKSWR